MLKSITSVSREVRPPNFGLKETAPGVGFPAFVACLEAAVHRTSGKAQQHLASSFVWTSCLPLIVPSQASGCNQTCSAGSVRHRVSVLGPDPVLCAGWMTLADSRFGGSACTLSHWVQFTVFHPFCQNAGPDTSTLQRYLKGTCWHHHCHQCLHESGST